MKRENELRVWEFLRTQTKVKNQYQANEYKIAQLMFNCKVKYNNLDVNKVYVSEIYKSFFVEFNSIDEVNEWAEFCEKHIFYAFYNPYKVYNLKNGNRTEFINQFIGTFGMVE